MLRRQFAQKLLNRYEDMLNTKQQDIEFYYPMASDEYKTTIPKILEALKDIANPYGETHAQSQEFLQAEFSKQLHLFLGESVGEIYQDGRDMLEHPNDFHVFRVSAGYANFFGNTLPEIAFSPYIAVYNASKGDDRGYTGLITTIIFAIPLIIPTIITALCAAVLAIAAGLVSPLVFAGAAIADACVNADDKDDLQPSFAAQ